MAITIRAKVDNELTNRVGSWFTVREIQDKLRINPSTLKPLIMKYARERLLRRRQVRGTARSVQFSPAARNANEFKKLLVNSMPYRNLGGTSPAATATSKKSAAKGGSRKSTPATKRKATRTTPKQSTSKKSTTAKKPAARKSVRRK